MNTMRRLLFTVLVVALLVGALAMPASVVAGPPPHVVGQASQTVYFKPADNEGLELTIPGVVTLEIPVNAIDPKAKAGDITVYATVTEEGIQVEIDSKLRKKDFWGQAVLRFAQPVTSAYEGFNQNDNKRMGGGTEILLDHFSRYSGWF
jgi:hypothetical protein